jgi:hypothetical protein
MVDMGGSINREKFLGGGVRYPVVRFKYEEIKEEVEARKS